MQTDFFLKERIIAVIRLVESFLSGVQTAQKLSVHVAVHSVQKVLLCHV